MIFRYEEYLLEPRELRAQPTEYLLLECTANIPEECQVLRRRREVEVVEFLAWLRAGSLALKV